MRRSDREVKEFKDIIAIMEKCDVCRVALNNNGYPYILPLNFGMDIKEDKIELYFHGAMEGTKYELIKKDNRASFEMDCEHNIILYEERMSCTMGYASVIGHGTIEFIDDEDKFEALKIIMRHYHHEEFKFSTGMMKATTVFRLKVLDMVGKRRNNIHPDEKTKTHVSLE